MTTAQSTDRGPDAGPSTVSPESAPRPAKRPQLDRAARRPGAGDHPDLRRAGEPAADPGPAARRGAGRARAGGRRRQPGRHRADRRRAAPRPTSGCTSCTAPMKAGLGAAYVAGFGWGLERGYDVLVEMDADGSHAPEQLPAAAGRAAARRRGARLPIRRRRHGGQLAQAPRRCSPAAATCTRGWRWACGSTTSPAATAPTGPRCCRTLPLGQVASHGLLLPGRPGLADGAGRVPGDRGADHVHRAGDRRRPR